jgi:exopolysaccharide production protein ExoQ
MPPQLALILTLGFIAFLFYRDIRQERQVSKAVWIPLVWLLLTGSRSFSEWVNIIFGIQTGAVDVEDGSPLDAVIFELLIFLGLYVLYRRRVSLTEVMRNNRWMTVFLAYCFLAIFWSDFPFVALKRWSKDLGLPIMVLIILTEPDPEAAIIQLLKRCSYIWVLISVLWIKYFPDLGRGFSSWDGSSENNGIAGNKNLLGKLLFISAVFYFWYFPKVWRWEKNKERRNELILIGLFGYLITWLMHLSQSSTALVASLIAGVLIIIFNFPRVNPKYISGYLVAVVLFFVVGEGVFGLYTGLLELLGRNPTLTGRTVIWQILLQFKINPILGSGFESFWMGDHLNPNNWPGWSFVPNEAHNCYLETYLNLGLVGLFLMVVWMFIAYSRARRDLINGSDWGRLRLGVIVALFVYNWTEVNLRGLDPLCFLFFLIAMDYPRAESATIVEPAKAESTGAKMTLAVAKNRDPVTNNQTPCHNLSQTPCILQKLA